MISWKVTKAEAEAIESIAFRANSALGLVMTDTMMDLTSTHANGNRLDLLGLITADKGNFAHDILGIRRHLDRQTGKLMDCFSPRFSEKAQTVGDGFGEARGTV